MTSAQGAGEVPARPTPMRDGDPRVSVVIIILPPSRVMQEFIHDPDNGRPGALGLGACERGGDGVGVMDPFNLGRALRNALIVVLLVALVIGFGLGLLL